MTVTRGALLVIFVVSTAWHAWASAPPSASVLGVEPERVHLVGESRATSFVVSLTNDSDAPIDVRLSLSVHSGGWEARLHRADRRFWPVGAGTELVETSVPPNGELAFVVLVRAADTLPRGAEVDITVLVEGADATRSELPLKARLTDRPKTYFVALDGCSERYLDLDRRGRPFGGAAERLMPRAHEFLQQAAYFPDAKVHLPTATDPDHLAALSGSWPGTLGIYSVNHFYAGRDANDQAVLLEGSKDLLRWGPDGLPIRTIFDLVKDPDAGGTIEAFGAFVSGKEWVGNLLRDDSGTVDVIAGAVDHPAYFLAPRRSRLGDPPSDPNAWRDRDGTNAGPRWLQRRFSVGGWYVNRHPEEFPDDDWISESAARLIAVEDPDILYTLLADCDTGQHLFGAADRPEEWQGVATPGILWDDVSRVHPRANRDPVLDIVFEADRAFGVILDTLRARQTLSRSLVVLLSDHGQTTVGPDLLDLGQILLSSGLAPGTIEHIISAGQLGFVYLADESVAPRVESILESHEEVDPVSGNVLNPFIVLNRGEMDSGVDGVEGHIAEDGLFGNKRGELYSEWSVDFPAPDNGKVRWPDLFVFNRSHFQNVMTSTDNLGGAIPITFTIGHHGSTGTSGVPLALSGSGIRPGVYRGPATVADIAPTLYRLLELLAPQHIDGRELSEIYEETGPE